ncbi:S-adenosyl-L-methionine-dependent methyltransferase [Morchella conica CCBAS932]|uniref:S-adenosyl-L-methionine-dependent methyltransferase n=1 Tax=Morchella conica CCBAS932 TaxID=1392247 RepID=A0A3N4L405_9PEZI|nr:S-adenosyl-L-methionine-dependent methyltransferase [Morchella conica CCBAS932]
MDPQVQLLRRQYLQLVEPSNLSFPTDPSTLRSPHFQASLYESLFAPNQPNNTSPPERYTARVLKKLITKLSEPPIALGGEEQDQEQPVIPTPSIHPAKKVKIDNLTLLPEQEIHEQLLELYTELLSRSSSAASPLDPEASRSYVTYIFPPSPFNGGEIGLPVTLHESRNIISGAGTTGLRTWEAALALSEYLICTHLQNIYKNTAFTPTIEGVGRVLREYNRVLELGAGTGLVSIVAARLGAPKVLATDGDSMVCEALAKNVHLSGVSETVTVRKRLWGDEIEMDEDFDLVVGADVTYDATVISYLIKELEQLFAKNSHIRVVISATIRNEDTFATFEKACRNSGFVLEQKLWIPPTPQIFFYDQIAQIRIIHITKSTAKFLGL